MSHEKFLALPKGRTLAYAEAGNLTSSTIFIFFHGVASVGDARRPSPVLVDKGIHLVAPTLPGCGNSSSPANETPYAACLIADTSALIDHLRPNTADLKLYICGFSFGTVAAQMLYGASYETFPHGRNIAGLLLLAPFSPFHSDKNYAKCMSWPNYISFGPPARIFPRKAIPRFTKMFLASKLSTIERAEMLMRDRLFDKMDEFELEAFAQWRESMRVAEGQFERETAENALRSVAKTWDGYLNVPDVLHSDWGGFTPDGLDEEHSRRPILIVSSKEDHETPEAWATYLVDNYRNARLKLVKGGHLTVLFHLDEILKEFLEL
jgi:pimeloyl-ACP methyl ester carboxylesterase